jgi:alkane 1-monooxygenase
VGLFVVGSASGYSAIVAAHELVHRPQPAHRRLGRALLWTVCYDHFHVEHVRGHHRRVGTAEDPATARHGEPLWRFVLRGVPGQFVSAWRLECRRLGDAEMGLFDRRQIGNQVLVGLVGQAAMLGAFLWAFGGAAAVGFALQAAWAVLLLEAVNYIEHWGLRRAEARVTNVDSFDAESGFTLYTLIGLARHADHHAHASRPYPTLRWMDDSPKMPWGYWATAVTAIFANPVARTRLDAELRRRGLGPYAA